VTKQSLSSISTEPLSSPRTVLILLTLTFAVNFADRTIINTVGEAIKQDLQLSDMQLGLLGGLSFAFLYSIVGIPLARLADRVRRKRLLAVAIGFWSLATMMCATATGYISLLLWRMGVGVGEAAGSPTSQSIITDYFPAEKRASAISILYLGIPLGIICSALGTGYIVEHFGWRYAFLIVGAPGLLLAAVIALVLKEPPRGRFDPAGSMSGPTPTTRDVVNHMVRTPGLMFVAFGIMFAGMSGYAFGQFFHPLLVRFSGMGYANAAAVFGIVSVLTFGVGSPLGGYLVERFGKSDPSITCRIPAIGIALSVPLKVLGFISGSTTTMIVMIVLGGIVFNMYHGPAFAAIHNRTPPMMRATATAVAIFLSAFVGLGMGPLLAGLLSDILMNTMYAGPGSFATSCGHQALAADPSLTSFCTSASGEGLRYALAGAQVFSVLAAISFAMAGKQMLLPTPGSNGAVPSASEL
jgi:MFS family permease